MDYLVVIDMQIDFTTGSLRNEDAIKIIPKIKNKIENFKGTVVYTQDTHFGNYMEIQEGRLLPVMHCIDETAGHKIEPSLLIPKNGQTVDDLIVIQKPSFGVIDTSVNRSGNVWRDIMGTVPSSIELCGTDTSICVMNNLLILKSLYPETPIRVCRELVADLNAESAVASLQIMKNCQIEVYEESP